MSWDTDIIVVDGAILRPVIDLKCMLCRRDGHFRQEDGSLVCIHCGMAVPALDSVTDFRILRVNLPKTWEVSWSR